MKFWTPTKEKLSTTLLLILLWVAFSVTSSLPQKIFNKYSFDLLATSNYGKSLTEPVSKYIQESQGARLNTTSELTSKLEMASHLNVSAQFVTGILIAYFGACIIRRRKPQ